VLVICVSAREWAGMVGWMRRIVCRSSQTFRCSRGCLARSLSITGRSWQHEKLARCCLCLSMHFRLNNTQRFCSHSGLCWCVKALHSCYKPLSPVDSLRDCPMSGGTLNTWRSGDDGWAVAERSLVRF
jgi:hypothetical protein